MAQGKPFLLSGDARLTPHLVIDLERSPGTDTERAQTGDGGET
jgi:hypothetical protein